jgi:hypothetical protein
MSLNYGDLDFALSNPSARMRTAGNRYLDELKRLQSPP